MSRPILAAVLLVACAGPQWKKPGATEADYAKAKNECEAQADRKSGNPQHWTSEYTESRLFSDCMVGRGWERY